MDEFIEIKDGEFNDHQYITSMSGGKDSTAILIYMIKELGIEPHRINPVFADTGHEHKITYAYLDYLELALDIKINHVQGKVGQLWKTHKGLINALESGKINNTEEPLTMESLSTVKGRFPSTMARFCTTELKLFPLRKFRDNFVKEHGVIPIMVSGVRRDESRDRANRKEWSWDTFMETTAWLPIVEWTAQEVFAHHDKWHIEPNQLYKEGMTRVGCFPCINCNKTELSAIALRFPETFDHLHAMEGRVADKSERGISSFFANDKTPKKYHSGFDKKTKSTYPQALDVKTWALGKEPDSEAQQELDLEGDDYHDFTGPACQSHYGLCE